MYFYHSLFIILHTSFVFLQIFRQQWKLIHTYLLYSLNTRTLTMHSWRTWKHSRPPPAVIFQLPRRAGKTANEEKQSGGQRSRAWVSNQNRNRSTPSYSIKDLLTPVTRMYCKMSGTTIKLQSTIPIQLHFSHSCFTSAVLLYT